MLRKESATDQVTLGEYLRQARLAQGLTLEQIAAETRISPRNLAAMENDDYAALPAEAFCRGFYSLYARILSLDTGEVLDRFTREKRQHRHGVDDDLPPPARRAATIGSMAQRPTAMHLSYFGATIFLLLAVGALLCWYFSWNPATFLSEQLRSLEAPKRAGQLIAPDGGLGSTAAPAARYRVNALFLAETDLTLTIDDHPQHALQFESGELASWAAEKRLVITLPADAHTMIALNDIPIRLPSAVDDRITIAIPDYIAP